MIGFIFIWKRWTAKLLLLCVVSVLLPACNDCNDTDEGQNGLCPPDQSGNDQNNGNNGDPGDRGSNVSDLDLTYMNCNSLDPGKVYVMGPIGPNPYSLYSSKMVITDPEDPSVFCLGFPGNDSSDGRRAYIDNTGQVYFGFSGTIYSFVADELTRDEDNQVVYPDLPVENDVLIHDSPEECGYLSLLEFNPVNNSRYHYQCDFEREIHSDSTDFFYVDTENPTDLLATFPDNSVLINPSFEYLSVIRPDNSVVELTLPESSMPVRRYEGSRYFTSDDSSGFWLIVIYYNQTTGEEYAGRWSIDIDTLTVTDDGLFSEKLSEVESTYNRTELDSAGNMYQIHFIPGSTQGGMGVMKRYLVSSGNPTESVFSMGFHGENSDDDWRDGNELYGTVSSGSLVTGP